MKTWLQNTKKNGFTIIEVTFALAICGLIMVTVFLAIPHVQRGVRDDHRRTIAANIEGAIVDYGRNNHGVLPLASDGTTNYYGQICAGDMAGCWQDFVDRYIKDKIDVTDPSTGQPVISYTDFNNDTNGMRHGVPQGYSPSAVYPANPGELAIFDGARCQGEAAFYNGGGGVKALYIAVLIGLERPGTLYCIDNH